MRLGEERGMKGRRPEEEGKRRRARRGGAGILSGILGTEKEAEPPLN